MRSSRRPLAAVLASAALVTAACGTDTPADTSAGGGPVTLVWWHNGTTDPLKSVWDKAAADYHGAHPDVTIKVQPIQNEDFTTKVPLALQSDSPPDVYQQWGGGDEGSQVQSGKVADITAQTSAWVGPLGDFAKNWQVGGKQYGVPYEKHVVGFWYRKDLLAAAGITTPPSTMEELTTAIGKLRANGVAPIALGGKDRWPDAFYWAYFAVRACSPQALQTAVQTLKLEDPCWVTAGRNLQAFLATKPFQDGFNGTPAQQGAGSSAGLVANGKAAMELQGDWNPGTMSSLTEDKALSEKLGWFPFPAVAGGAGNPAAVLGGGDGFSCTTKAATACAGFLQYLTSEPVQRQIASSGAGLPVNPAAASALTDPSLKTALDYTSKAPYLQMYFDRAFPTNVGSALNEAIANLFAGKGSPEAIVQAVNQAGTGGR